MGRLLILNSDEVPAATITKRASARSNATRWNKRSERRRSPNWFALSWRPGRRMTSRPDSTAILRADAYLSSPMPRCLKKKGVPRSGTPIAKKGGIAVG